MAVNVKISDNKVYDDGCLRVEYDNYYATWRGEYLRLTKSEFIIFSTLVMKCERFVPRDEIWFAVWGNEKKYCSDSLRVQVCRLRKKIEPLGMGIEALLGIGYRFIPAANPDTAIGVKTSGSTVIGRSQLNVKDRP